MGIIINQSIKGSIWSYLGVGIGFITTGYLFPNYLTTDTIGLFSLLLAWSVLFAQLSSLGFQGITGRLFPWFRNRENNHNGYLFIAFAVMFMGFSLFLILFWFMNSWLVESNLEKSKLFADYLYLLIPLTFFTLLFTQLDVFNKLLYDAVFGTFLQEFLQRLLILLATLLFVFQIINLHFLILTYAASVCAKGVVIFVYLGIKKEISFRPQLQFVKPTLRKEMISVGFFSILTGLGSNIVFNIDKILINQLLGLGETGVYAIAFFFGTLVIIPSRTLLRISGTLIADAFKRKDLGYIADIYRRSCLNQFIIGAFLFGGIWINIDNILVILGPDYEGAKWVIFFIGLGYLVDMMTGANAQIIAFSEHYRVALYFILILIVLVVVTMFILVPLWGITGAAIAIAASLTANNFMRFLFLKLKYKMQPFDRKILVAAFVFVLSVLVSTLIPQVQLLPDIFLRSTLFTIIFVALTVGFKISEDVDLLKDKILMNFKK
ncbi:lipopolysaccharide biosynthesis protein [Mariniphaga sp.]|uniref:lipopolysaccharide biosynthesis protein n=1 Tax=Mariniphaga sp. TaxID=1954475 RepID=UPI003567D948